MTTWEANIPPDPGTQITEVWDDEGDLWERVTRSSYWHRPHDGIRKPWENLVYQHGPVTDVPPGPEPPDDAQYALTESGEIHKRRSQDEWENITDTDDYYNREPMYLPTDETYTFLKEV